MEDTEAEGLYALPLEEFTAARNKLAAARRKAGDRPGGEAIRSLPKPSRTAWALNQVARSQPDIVERVLDAGRALRAAHARALQGDAGDLRAATKKEQEAVRVAVEAARRVLTEGSGPPSAAQLDRLRDTVQAAAISAEAGQDLRAGRLVADLHPSGFALDDWSGGGLPGPPERAPDRPSPQSRERNAARAEARRRALRAEADQATATAERLGAEAARSEARAARARAEAEEAEHRAAELQQQAQEARRQADEALDGATAARRAADAAARETGE